MTLGEYLRRERVKHGWTQGELAAKIDIARENYNKIERDKADPTASTLDKLAACGIDLGAYFGRERA